MSPFVVTATEFFVKKNIDSRFAHSHVICSLNDTLPLHVALKSSNVEGTLRYTLFEFVAHHDAHIVLLNITPYDGAKEAGTAAGCVRVVPDSLVY